MYISLNNILGLFEEGGSVSHINGKIIGEYLIELLNLFLLFSQNRLFTLRSIV